MVPLLVITAIWIIWCALWWWLIAATEQPQPAGPAPDPYADEVARFRRELHDWDRP